MSNATAAGEDIRPQLAQSPSRSRPTGRPGPARSNLKVTVACNGSSFAIAAKVGSSRRPTRIASPCLRRAAHLRRIQRRTSESGAAALPTAARY